MSRDAAGGLFWGLIIFLVVCALLGAVNRGLWGLLIGAVSGGLLGAALGLAGGLLWARAHPSTPPRAAVHIILEAENARYVPGEPVSGYVQLDAENTFRSRGLRVYFACRGFYAHDVVSEAGDAEPQFVRESRQYLLQQDELLPAGIVNRISCATYPFRFQIPIDALPTHHGYACAIRWFVHATLELDGREPIKAQQELFVESMPPLLSPMRERYQSEAAQPDCQLILTLPTAVCAEGGMVEARIHISPLEPVVVQEVRALLLRIENTPQGDDHTVYIDRWDPVSGRFHGQRQPGGQGTTYVWLEDEAILVPPGPTELRHPLIQTVQLRIPAQWRPTIRTKDGQVLWKVGVVVARENAEDLRAFHEILVHTGAAEITELLDPQQAGAHEAISDATTK
ncbi:MAG: hypothetical protein H5T69_15675 [Chloroflexi bacterium]|nr:hypothetical protein [Chloroflexota bacterium]